MIKFIIYSTISSTFLSCNYSQPSELKDSINSTIESYPKFINEISLPKGYKRMETDSNSFEYYLQHLTLKKDNTIYYFDGNIKPNQTAHEAVIDISVSNKDLQQCADAIMRLRAEYFFAKKEYSKIEFKSSNKTYNFKTYINNIDTTQYRKALDSYLLTVFANCGTYNLAEMLINKTNKQALNIGDVFVKGGSPGHAMIVVDVAINKTTKQQIFLLAQSFMPAQSVHIVKNLNDKNLSPWYNLDTTKIVETPGYSFDWKHLKSW